MARRDYHTKDWLDRFRSEIPTLEVPDWVPGRWEELRKELPMYKAMLVLKLEGATHGQIASFLGKNRKYVQSMMSAARRSEFGREQIAKHSK